MPFVTKQGIFQESLPLHVDMKKEQVELKTAGKASREVILTRQRFPVLYRQNKKTWIMLTVSKTEDTVCNKTRDLSRDSPCPHKEETRNSLYIPKRAFWKSTKH